VATDLSIPASQSVSNPRSGEKKRQIVLLARELNEIGWGNQGDIMGAYERVEIAKLWPNPFHPIQYTDEELDAMKESLQAEGQKDEIVVAYAQAPANADDYAGATLLIIDGHKRYWSALRAGWDKVRVKASTFTSLTQVMIDFASRTLSRHVLTPLEIGRTILAIRLAYENERTTNPNVPPFPTQEDLGRMLGRSQSTVSTWLKLAMQPADFVQLVDAGDITVAQAMELIRLPDEGERVKQALLLADKNQDEEVVPHSEVRSNVTAQRSPLQMDSAAPLNYGDLWTPRIKRDTPSPVAMAYMARDLSSLLLEHVDAAKEAQETAHPAIAKLLKALMDPSITQFIVTITSDR